MEEEDLHFYILIDNSLSMDFGDPTKLHYAKQVAAALAFIGLVNIDRVRLEVFSDRSGPNACPPPAAGAACGGCWTSLDKLEPAGASDLAARLQNFRLKPAARASSSS